MLDNLPSTEPATYPLSCGKVMIQAGTTKPLEGALLEAHRQYLDVMYMVEGEETIYVKTTAELANITKEYDPSIEALLATLDSDATPVRLTKGHFIVLFPQDAHAPACDTEKTNAVKKIIGKVRI